MPHPDGVAVWPEEPFQLPNEEMLDSLIKAGWLLCGDPTRWLSRSSATRASGVTAGLGLPSDSVEHEEVLEMLELFGTKVIPIRLGPGALDDPLPPAGGAQVPEFNHPVPDVEVTVLPTNALLS